MITTHHKKILMITPFHKQQRGNHITTARLKLGLSSKGLNIDLLSLEEKNWPEIIFKGITDNKYVLIHGFNARYFAQVLSLVPEVKTIPLVLTTTGTDINFDLTSQFKDLVISSLQAAQVIVIFNDDFKNIISNLGLEFSNRIITIPQSVNLPAATEFNKNRSHLGINENDTVYLLPSGLRPIKNIELAINALEKVHASHPHIHLLIMGAIIDKQYSRYIMNRINDLNWVSYLGEIPHKEMPGILSCGDVVLNTSVAEGQPQGALEAMTLFKPCILTAVPGNLNIIEHSKEGFYVKNQDELIAAAQKLINIPLRLQMGRAAGKLVKEKFAMKQEINSYYQIYKDLINLPF